MWSYYSSRWCVWWSTPSSGSYVAWLLTQIAPRKLNKAEAYRLLFESPLPAITPRQKRARFRIVKQAG